MFSSSQFAISFCNHSDLDCIDSVNVFVRFLAPLQQVCLLSIPWHCFNILIFLQPQSPGFSGCLMTMPQKKQWSRNDVTEGGLQTLVSRMEVRNLFESHLNKLKTASIKTTG